MSPVGPRQFALFRIVLGLLLAGQLLAWWPWADELFGRGGLPGIDPGGPGGVGDLFPSLLAPGGGSPGEVRALLAALLVAAGAFALGIARRVMAIGLWYGWTALGLASPLVQTVASAYIGWLLLASVLVPVGEPLRPFGRRRSGGGAVPRAVTVGAWIVLAAGYGLSGLDKLESPGWRSGGALGAAVGLPYAREWGAAAILALPLSLQRIATWSGLAIELAFPLLALLRWTRPVAWAAGVALQLGLLFLFAFPGLTIGMLMMHAFTFDARWIPRRPRDGAPRPARPSRVG